jgi:hypothetical protein
MSKDDKRKAAEATLPAELHGTFNALSEDYKVAAETYTGQVWVNYNILADLVRGGWRKQSPLPRFNEEALAKGLRNLPERSERE